MFFSKLQCEQSDSCGAPVPPRPRLFLSMLVLTSALDRLSQGI